MKRQYREFEGPAIVMEGGVGDKNCGQKKIENVGSVS